MEHLVPVRQRHLGAGTEFASGRWRQSGITLGGNAYHGVAINDCCEQAEAITLRV